MYLALMGGCASHSTQDGPAKANQVCRGELTAELKVASRKSINITNDLISHTSGALFAAAYPNTDCMSLPHVAYWPITGNYPMGQAVSDAEHIKRLLLDDRVKPEYVREMRCAKQRRNTCIEVVVETYSSTDTRYFSYNLVRRKSRLALVDRFLRQ